MTESQMHIRFNCRRTTVNRVVLIPRKDCSVYRVYLCLLMYWSCGYDWYAKSPFPLFAACIAWEQVAYL